VGEEQSKAEGNSSLTKSTGVFNVQEDHQDTKETEEALVKMPPNEKYEDFGLPRQLASHILLVARKSVTKLSPDIKFSMCKRCSSVLITGRTSEVRVENKSRGGRKPWADVMLVTCLTCGMEKRYPVGAAVSNSSRVKASKKS
jgi:RNase P subunit RPR2